MSLLDAPPNTVTVYAATEVVDADTGMSVRVPGDPTGVGVELRCWVQYPQPTADIEGGSFRTSTDRVLFARSFPGAARSLVLWAGTLWDVPEEPVARQGIAGMHYVHVRLTSRGPGGDGS